MASQVSGGQPVGGERAEQGIVHLPEDAVWETAVPVRGGGGECSKPVYSCGDVCCDFPKSAPLPTEGEHLPP